MDTPKIIEQTPDYNLYENDFNGYKNQFRMWHNGVTEMKFDDNFALSNGFKNLQDLLDKIHGMREYLNQVFGCIPEWITIDNTTGFIGFPLLNTQTKASTN